MANGHAALTNGLYLGDIQAGKKRLEDIMCEEEKIDGTALSEPSINHSIWLQLDKAGRSFVSLSECA